MQDDYVGPDMQTVPLGWFSEAAGVAARALPGGIVISSSLTEKGFHIEARRGAASATESLSFFDLAMTSGENPFLLHIERAVAGLRSA